MPKHVSHAFEPSSLVRPAAKRTPYDQTRLMEMKGAQTGKLGGLGAKVTGGTMNMGGKRRPSSGSSSQIRRGHKNSSHG